MSARDPASTDADPSSGGPDDDGRAAAVGPVAPVLPPGYRTVVALRALRLGALVAGAVLLGLLGTERREVVLLDSLRLRLLTACIAVVLIGIATAARDRIGRAHTAVAGLLATGIAMAAAAWLVRMWWAAYRECTITSSVYLIAAALLLALGVLVAAGVLLRRARTRLGARRRAPDDPARWRRLYGPATGAGRPETTCEDELPHSRLSMWADSLRLLIAEIPRPVLPTHAPLVLRARTRALLAVVALLPALALAAGALVPATLLKPVARTTAPADSEPPARPTALGGGIAWTYDADFIDVVAGAAGPIVLTPEGVTALNGEDGSVRWTYQRRAVYLNERGGRMTAYDGAHGLIVSPDARHVAVQMQGPALDHPLSQDDPGHLVLTVVLDSVTGEVTAEHRGAEEAESAEETDDAQHRPATGTPLQMTDSVAVAGREAFALDGGKTLWTLPKDAFTKDTVGYSGTAGHSTVIVSEDTGCPACGEAPTLRIAPDHDPTATTDVTNVLPNLDVNGVTVADGWVARFTDGYSPPRADDDSGANQEAQAVSIDALASAGETAPVPLGAVNSTVAVASAGSGTLVAASAIAEPRPYDGEMVISGYQVATVLDPATGTATPAAEYPGLAAAEVGLRTRVESTQATTSFVIEPADGSPGASLQVPPGTVLAPQRLAKRQNEKEHKLETPFTDPSLVALASPGATVMVLNASSPGFDSTRIHRLYGIGEQ